MRGSLSRCSRRWPTTWSTASSSKGRRWARRCESLRSLVCMDIYYIMYLILYFTILYYSYYTILYCTILYYILYCLTLGVWHFRPQRRFVGSSSGSCGLPWLVPVRTYELQRKVRDREIAARARQLVSEWKEPCRCGVLRSYASSCCMPQTFGLGHFVCDRRFVRC